MDRNWDELRQELRVTQTGGQILSGFLLTLPFQQRFTTLPAYFRVIFLVAVSFSTLATGLIIALVSAHGLLFRKQVVLLIVLWLVMPSLLSRRGGDRTG